jgi:GAF domain-containing protein
MARPLCYRLSISNTRLCEAARFSSKSRHRRSTQATEAQFIDVVLCEKLVTGISCPECLVRYVIRMHESVILDDASKPNLFSGDDYLRGRQAKSILCLPLIKQGRSTGLL